MALIRFTRRSPLPPERAWERLTRWERHADHVPLTRITVRTAGPSGPGTRFVARTGLGRAGVDDPMEVVRWQPPRDGCPGVCRVVKRGSVVVGWAEFEVRACGAGCEVEWREELAVRGMPRLLDPLTAWCGRMLFGRVVGALLRAPEDVAG